MLQLLQKGLLHVVHHAGMGVPHLFIEFTIKSYPEHDGVTEQIAKLQPGDQVEGGVDGIGEIAITIGEA